MKLDRRAPLWRDDPAYETYARAQAEKTQRHRDYVAGTRVAALVGLLVRRTFPQSPIGRSVLAVGCRNTHELSILHAAGFGPIVGIDLLSTDPQIRAMDMHALAFPPQSFDVIFASHVLEHAYDADRALSEWARVTRPGGHWAIELPVSPLGSPDRQSSFASARDVAARCAQHGASVLVKEENLSPDPNIANVARLLLQVWPVPGVPPK